MARDVGFSTTSPDSPADEDGSTNPDDDSSVSDDHMHIGTSPRPPLPLNFPGNSMSKSLPPRLVAGIVSRGLGPAARSRSAHPHPTWGASGHPPPAPAPSLPPPPFAHRASSYPSQPLKRRDRPRSSLGEPQCWGDQKSHGNGRDSRSSPSLDSGESGVEAQRDSDCVRRLGEHYIGLQKQRSLLSGKFSSVSSQQAHVRKSRQTRDEVARKFMAAARALLPDSTQLYQLHQLFNDMQDAHLGHQEAEQRLEDVEDEWQLVHEDLKSQEAAFYKNITEALGPTTLDVEKDQDGTSVENEDKDVLRGISGERPEAIHPLYEKLRAAFGELQLAKELLANTRMKRETLHARKTQALAEDSLDLLETYGDAGKRKAVELRTMALMTEDDIEQLQEYDMLEQDAKQDIERYTEKVRTLQQECRDNGALPSSSYFHQEIFGPDSFYRDEIRLPPSPFDSNDESATLAHPVFPLLLSNPTHLLHGFPQTSLQSLKRALQLPQDAPAKARQVKEAAHEANMHSLLIRTESENKSEYINRWLLHKLHHSAMEAELLWTTFRSRLKILDIDRWQRDVLHFWWRDELIVPVSVGMEGNSTDKASDGSGVEYKRLPHSESGQLEGLRNWRLDDSWP